MTITDLHSQPIPVTVPDRLLLAAKVALVLIEDTYGAEHFAAHLLSDAITDTEKGKE